MKKDICAKIMAKSFWKCAISHKNNSKESFIGDFIDILVFIFSKISGS
jgi:hypothetical protein